jgi:hypothetical protein
MSSSNWLPSNRSSQLGGNGNVSSQHALSVSRMQSFASTTYLFSKNPLGLSGCVSSILVPRFTPRRSRMPVNADVPLRCIPKTTRQFFIDSLCGVSGIFVICNIQSQPNRGGCEKYYNKNITARRLEEDIFGQFADWRAKYPGLVG